MSPPWGNQLNNGKFTYHCNSDAHDKDDDDDDDDDDATAAQQVHYHYYKLQ